MNNIIISPHIYINTTPYLNSNSRTLVKLELAYMSLASVDMVGLGPFVTKIKF